MDEHKGTEGKNVAKISWQDQDGKSLQIFLYTDAATLVGRELDNHIVLSDPLVSKHHAEIQWVDDAFVISDLGSSNGTYVNRNIVREPTNLNHGDRIDIGGVVLWFKSRDSFATKPIQEESEPLEGSITNEFTYKGLETVKITDSNENDLTPGEEAQMNESPYKTLLLPNDDDLVDVIDDLSGSSPEHQNVINSELTTNFDSLMDTLQIAQDQCQTLDKKNMKIQEAILNATSKLQDLFELMNNYKGADLETETVTLLTQLSDAPSDVNLLMALARHSPYLLDIYKDYISTKDAIKQIHENLTTIINE